MDLLRSLYYSSRTILFAPPYARTHTHSYTLLGHIQTQKVFCWSVCLCAVYVQIRMIFFFAQLMMVVCRSITLVRLMANSLDHHTYYRICSKYIKLFRAKHNRNSNKRFSERHSRGILIEKKIIYFIKITSIVYSLKLIVAVNVIENTDVNSNYRANDTGQCDCSEFIHELDAKVNDNSYVRGHRAVAYTQKSKAETEIEIKLATLDL